jgi:hypothetical protein
MIRRDFRGGGKDSKAHDGGVAVEKTRMVGEGGEAAPSSLAREEARRPWSSSPEDLRLMRDTM